jgi:hypothetical protein
LLTWVFWVAIEIVGVSIGYAVDLFIKYELERAIWPSSASENGLFAFVFSTSFALFDHEEAFIFGYVFDEAPLLKLSFVRFLTTTFVSNGF